MSNSKLVLVYLISCDDVIVSLLSSYHPRLLPRNIRYLPRPDFDAAKKLIGNFIRTAPPDTHYFAQAHFELARAALDELASTRGRPAPRAAQLQTERTACEVEALVTAAASAVDVPIFRRLDDTEFPMMADVKGVLAMLQMGLARRNHGGGGATHVQTAVQEACWNCDSNADPGVKLQACARCGLAVYCNRDCQRSHWAEHKHACKQAKPCQTAPSAPSNSKGTGGLS